MSLEGSPLWLCGRFGLQPIDPGQTANWFEVPLVVGNECVATHHRMARNLAVQQVDIFPIEAGLEQAIDPLARHMRGSFRERQGAETRK